MMRARFQPWRAMRAEFDRKAVRAFVSDAAEATEDAFKAGMRSGKSGRIYRRKRGSHQASAPGEYPAIDSGALIATVGKKVRAMDMEVGSSAKPYALYLRTGTGKMARRKMSDDALKEALPGVRSRLKAWARFRHA